MQVYAHPAGTKNLRAALPRGGAEDLDGNRSLDAQTVASHGPTNLGWIQAQCRGGRRCIQAKMVSTS
jgi:hypothetical protein